MRNFILGSIILSLTAIVVGVILIFQVLEMIVFGGSEK